MSGDIQLRSRKNASQSETNTNESNTTHTKKDTPELKKHSSNDPNQYYTFHSARDSLLSSASGYTNYRGILNLCVVLLVMSTGRLVLENMLKYGFLVRFDVPILFIKDPTAWPALLAIVVSNVFIKSALVLEQKLEKSLYSEKTGMLCCFVNVTLSLLIPAMYMWYRETNPISSFFALAIYTVISMKLISYFQVNAFLRRQRKHTKYESSNSKDSTTKVDNNNNNNNNHETKLEETNVEHSTDEKIVTYPNNLNYRDIYYFIAAPTLCYEINFPRTKRIRKGFLVRRCLEIMFLLTLQFILIQQWVMPILENSKIPMRETNILKMTERLLKLAVPNHVIWLIAFYTMFHSYLNVLAELLRFGDREFYLDWWNAQTVAQFWKNWNIPVHHFCLRHIYKPLLGMGITKLQAQLIVFFVSAFFHEYLVSIPLRMFRLWSFFGMIMQIPFAAFVQRFLHGNYGNMAVWISLIIGQPIAILMYIHDYYIDSYSNASTDMLTMRSNENILI
jgi:diacylglycerol O-acyltransferase-1